MIPNRTLEKLRRDEPAYGLAVTSGAPSITCAFAREGLDWIWIDTQHGYWTDAGVQAAIQALVPTGVTPVVRVGKNDFFLIGKALDAGALGVIVPMVNSAAEAEQAVAATRYPPDGERSIGGIVRCIHGDDYAAHANDSILLAVMIETPEAVEAAESIAAVPGVDCLLLGPSDLANNLGVEPGTERHEACIQRVLESARSQGVAAGFPCGNLTIAKERVAQGFRLVHCGTDMNMLYAAAAEVCAEIVGD